ncbi:MAG: OmpA family protein [Acidobacteria bacterium]|nr:OmpA family protein [Acidobacteriota bacterium]
MRAITLGAVVLCLLAATRASAQQDEAGCKDYPLFTRFSNMHIVGCQSRQFDLRTFPVGPGDKDGNTKPIEVEGAVQWIKYELNEGATPPSGLQIMRNFENAAKKAGGSIEGQYPDWCKANYDQEHMPDMGNGCMSFGLTMKFVRGGKEVWAFLQADGDGGSYLLTVSEREAMKQEISVTELVDKLAKDGFIALYVNFETGKSAISPDSAPTLDAAANALKAAGGLRVEVAGHTDNVGTPEANLKLSQDRAQAVMTALTERGIKADRLTAKGYGQTAPIADNRTEEGRAKNRRVELVKK